MTEHRPEPRSTAQVAVRVYGMGADGKAFFQNALATNLSHQGALLEQIEHELKVGEIIGVQYGDKKVRCRVVWVIKAETTAKNQAGVRLLPDQECPWKDELVAEAPAAEATESSDNRRRYYRHRTPLSLQLWDQRSAAPMRINATDVSGNGCYIETILPFAKGTQLQIDFWIDAQKISTPAVVRTCDGGVGMGIEFTGLKEEDRRRFQKYLDEIDPQPADPEPSASGESPKA
jgi:PilZ domain